MHKYPTNLSDKQLQAEKICLLPQKLKKISVALCFDCILYMLKPGAQWKMPHKYFAPWQNH